MSERNSWLKLAMDVKCFCTFGPDLGALFALIREGFIEEMGGEWYRKTAKAFNQ